MSDDRRVHLPVATAEALLGLVARLPATAVMLRPEEQQALTLLTEAHRRATGGLPRPDAPRSSAPKRVVFVDVDDTLVRSFGSKRIPMTAVIERVHDLHATGAAELYCWSRGGATYAHESAVELGLAPCFVGYLSKPDLVVDDQAPHEWRELTVIHPNEAASRTAEDLLGLPSSCFVE
jgi:hypothetical protein